MRVARFRHEGEVGTGVVLGDEVARVPGSVLDVVAGSPEVAGAPRLPLAAVELLAPIERPPKYLAIGLNYADHLAETGMATPEFPVFFNKQSTCVIGPHDPIHVPRVSTMVDYEGELGIVIGRRCRHVPAERAHEVIGGYLVIDDVTVRDWQLRSPTMTLGKSFDTHGPTGPWIVTGDDVADPQDLRIRTWVNGELMQDASTKEMIFGCFEQVETLSRAFTLEAGDLIATGTPAGVGFVRKPPVWLRAGDTVRVEIEGIGTIQNPVVAEPDDTVVI